MEVIIYLGINANIFNYNLDNKYIIASERGALSLALNKISFDLAIGDFDSVEDKDILIIKKYAKKFIKLNPIKDDTDTAAALSVALEISNDITIIGGIAGNRVEHLFANICLLNKYPNIKLIDDNSLIFSLDNDYVFSGFNDYKFISFYAQSDSVISLRGFKYNLDNYNLKLYDPLCVSNEFALNPKIEIKKGRILVILSKNDIV